MAWYLAPALQVLRAEVDTRWPERDRASDGSIGDTAHAATRSDHNPNNRESVNAIDIDIDGVTVAAIIAAAERHPSVHYWIYNRQIADRDSGFARRRYTGSNPHDKHIHISIRQTRAAEQDRRPWGLLVEEEEDMPLTADDAQTIARAVVNQKLGSSGPTVQVALQAVPALEKRVTALEKLITTQAEDIAREILAGLPEDRDDVTVEELTEAFRRAVAGPQD